MNISDINTGVPSRENFFRNFYYSLLKLNTWIYNKTILYSIFSAVKFYLNKTYFNIIKPATIFPFILVIICIIFSGCSGVAYHSTRIKTDKEDIYIRVVIFKNTPKLLVEAKNAVLTSAEGFISLPAVSEISIVKGYALIDGIKRSLPFYIKSPDPIFINGMEFYGYIDVREDIVVNIIPIEEYLKGVLSSEMSPTWPLEALKAQAVVSRTYAVKKILESKNQLFDVDNTEMYQKFNYSRTESRIDEAVRSTEGIIILYRGKPIDAFFHSCSGGRTESSRDIFQQDLSYLRSIPDPYSNRNQHNFWSFKVESNMVKENLKTLIEPGNRDLKLLDVRIKSKTSSGRVSKFLLIFEQNRQQVIPGNTFRLALGPKELKSLLIDSIHTSKTGNEIYFTFSGRGYGHGVGMSQWGAREMATLGFGYKKIIAYYYRGTTLGQLNNLLL